MALRRPRVPVTMGEAKNPFRTSTTSGLVIGLGATAAVALCALGGTLLVEPGIKPWPRFWATLFFAALLWPTGLALITRLAGARTAIAAAVLVVAATGAQQLGVGTLPLPLVVGWTVSLSAPGDAIRRELPLSAAGDREWERAWRSAQRAAIAVCSPDVISPEAGVVIALNGAEPVPLAALERKGPPGAAGWYNLPVTRDVVERQAPLVVELRREGVAGPPARFCGGQDDPDRQDRGASLRWSAGRWTSDNLADVPVPLVSGRPASSRYYIELRFYDANGLPHAGIWY
ncbi:MAG: hypothetical protein AVDCRST_MAG77-4298 [uncultured Chloroflexi bacterium]|uniref:Uncharacterized protein n=1 Tax=uncultured Chloroflexota bacterium TaxID=166587 RepID=A0A6J4JK44_9CHLR|nr:MAG: hypothetical protein AVDCRST_MAG77-4298 [uncultured Chloroflexota bacterium]